MRETIEYHTKTTGPVIDETGNRVVLEYWGLAGFQRDNPRINDDGSLTLAGKQIPAGEWKQVITKSIGRAHAGLDEWAAGPGSVIESIE